MKSEKTTKNDESEIEEEIEFIDESEIEEKPQEFIALLKVYSPIIDPAKPKWKFDIGGGDIQSVDISETSIAEDMVKRGIISVRDIYRVRLELTQIRTNSNKTKNYYKMKEVLKIIPGHLYI